MLLPEGSQVDRYAGSDRIVGFYLILNALYPAKLDMKRVLEWN
jgi:hypothetical protein